MSEAEFMEWEPRFELDVPEMDRDHRRIIAFTNQLHRFHVSDAGIHPTGHARARGAASHGS